ncbi:Endonuclease 3 [Pseudolycoriella hygida]|uniref:Endonuclease 3 n=1 Tax=Pseudolycoriella hygida TaxID=35572 RepID=A0A9Q0N0L8_9DIPT|nr:Endonuclease 3 [Pseudolycoriella hygida]
MLKLSKLPHLVALFAIFVSVKAWGRDGHALVADLAQTLLTFEAATFVKLHLPLEANGNMSNVSVWADNILYANTEPNYLNWRWSAPLHYVNTKDFSCVYDRQTDCDWASTRGCVDGAIQNYTTRLGDKQLDETQLEEALKFIIHFIADVHQPLHGGFASDLGGNSIRGDFFGQTVNLHSLWDTTMIQRKINTKFQSQRSLYLNYLIDQMNGRFGSNISDWSQCSSTNDTRYLACSSIWIQEDAELCCKIVYLDENGDWITAATGFNITEEYYNTRMESVELRLIQGGVRLANVINRIVHLINQTDGTNDTQTLSAASLPLIAFILICFVFFN